MDNNNYLDSVFLATLREAKNDAYLDSLFRSVFQEVKKNANLYSLYRSAFEKTKRKNNTEKSDIDTEFETFFANYFTETQDEADSVVKFDQLSNSYRNIFEASKEGLVFLQNGRFNNEFICESKNDKDLIGYGGFGEVFKAKHKYDEHIYAIKRQDFFRSDEKKEKEEVDRLLRELIVNAVIKYDFLLNYKSFWFESDKKVAHLYIQMELCAMDLKNVVKMSEKITPNIMHLFVITNIFQEIVIGVQYLHTHEPKIFHRDLKPANILLTKGENGRFIKIADFGFAKFLLTDKNSSNINTAADYTAPEVKSGYYTTLADIFSLGMVLAKISNFLPKYDKTESDRAVQVYETKLSNLMILKSKMIDHVSKNRPTCEEMLADKSWLLTDLEAKNMSKFKSLMGNTSNDNVYDIHKTFFEYYTLEKLKYSKSVMNQNSSTGFLSKIFS